MSWLEIFSISCCQLSPRRRVNIEDHQGQLRLTQKTAHERTKFSRRCNSFLSWYCLAISLDWWPLHHTGRRWRQSKSDFIDASYPSICRFDTSSGSNPDASVPRVVWKPRRVSQHIEKIHSLRLIAMLPPFEGIPEARTCASMPSIYAKQFHRSALNVCHQRFAQRDNLGVMREY